MKNQEKDRQAKIPKRLKNKDKMHLIEKITKDEKSITHDIMPLVDPETTSQNLPVIGDF